MRGRFPPCSRIIDHPPSDAGDEPPGGEEPARVERRLDAAHERDALSWIAPHVDLRLHLRRRALDHERAAARLEAGPERGVLPPRARGARPRSLSRRARSRPPLRPNGRRSPPPPRTPAAAGL